MISWIQRYFQRHFAIIFVLVLAAMAIPLVVVFTPSSGIGQGGQDVATRNVFGYNLGSQEDQARLFGDANLSATLQLGYSGMDSDQLQQYALQRAAALELATQLNLPASSKAEVADYIKGLRAFSTPEGGFDTQRYNAFRDSLKAGGRYSEADVSRIIAADVRVDKVRQLLAGPGYVLDADVVTQLKRIATTWTLGLATINYSDFKPSITATNDQLAKFFSDNTFRYEIGPRVSASYVKFPAADHMARISVTEDELKALFAAAPGRYKLPAQEDKTPAKVAGADDFALVRDQVEANLRLAKARQLATKAASDFSLAIYESKLTNDPDTLASFLSAHQVKEVLLNPFTQAAGPAELNNSADVTTAAFKLDGERFYSDAVPVIDGAVVLLWKDTLPPRTPLMSEVQYMVSTDYMENEKRKLFVELGRKAKSLLETRLKAGVDLATAVKAVSDTVATPIEAKMLTPFSAANPPAEGDFSYYNTLDNLEQGGVSDMIITREKGVMVYAAGKKLPDLTKANPQYETTRNQIAAVTARMGANKILEEMVERELKKSEPKLN